ncbi:MAG: hypothetical protein KAW90_04860 [Dehalococcoidales bacterium]|nr:hypothetical protein [Dehalococcoidales bacterium]
MAMLKYSKYIVTDPKPVPSDLKEKFETERRRRKSTIQSTHLLTVDDEIIKDFFYVDCNWLWKGSAEDTAEESHAHDFDEVIGFIGSNREDPHDLGGEITIWLDDEKQVLTKSCLIFIPAGIRHCPIRFNRIDQPVFFVTISPAKRYSRISEDGKASLATSEIKPGKNLAAPKYTIITETKDRFTVAASGTPPPRPTNSTLKSARILHLEDDMAKGSFYVDFVWIYEGSGAAPAPEHSHEWEEVIAMIGADPENPRDLGGTMSIVLGDETHTITKSSLVCIPRGLKHCPWKFIDIKKPTLVFTAGPSGMYTGSHTK